MDAAYPQIHANATNASTCISIVSKLAFLCLQLPFETTPVPAEYKNISKSEIDLGNDFLGDKSWDTENLSLPHRTLLPKEDKQQSANHLVKSDLLTMDITATEASMDGFINNIITITVDEKNWIERAKSTALLVIHTLFRPLQPCEPLKRDDPLSLRKLAREG